MNAMIHGIDVKLIKLTQTGVDSFGVPTYSEQKITVSNVIVSPTSEAEQLETVNLYGKRAEYTLCIPMVDTNNWQNTFVEFFGRRWRTIGDEKVYMEHLVPLEWNKQVRVEHVS